MKNQNCILFLAFSILTSCFISTGCERGIGRIVITGKVDSINGTIVRLTNTDYSVVYDSTIVENNGFKFNGTVPEAGFYYIDFTNNTPFKDGVTTLQGWGHGCLLYLEKNAKYEFKADGKVQILYDFYTINSSSYNQQALSEYYSGVNLKRHKLRKTKNDYLLKTDIFLKQGNNDQYRKYLDSVLIIENEEHQVYVESTYEFIKKNPHTLITPYLITKMSDFFEKYALYKSVLDGLEPDVKKTEYAQKAFKLLKSVEKLYIGGDVPQIFGSDIDGKPFTYNYSKNTYTLIDLWASWCLPCRRQTPQLKAIYQKYKSKGFDIIAVSVDEKKEWWTRISKLDEIPWYNVSESVKSEDSKNIENFVAKRLPLNYLVDNRGKIMGRDIEPDSLDRFLEKYLRLHKE